MNKTITTIIACTLVVILGVTIVSIVIRPSGNDWVPSSSTNVSRYAPTISMNSPTTPTSPITNMTLTSDQFADGASIPALYTCKGQGISPPLTISGVPDSAITLALIMEDPDATIGTFDHWLVYNMPASTTVLPAASTPPGTLGLSSSGDMHYVGPCPTTGVHRYIFTLYALDTTLSVPAGATKKALQQAMTGHIVAQASLMGMFSKQ